MLKDLRDHLHRAGRVNVHPDDRPVRIPWTVPTTRGNWRLVSMAAVLVLISGLLVWATGKTSLLAIGVFGPFLLYFLVFLNPKGVFDFLYRRSHVELGTEGATFAITGADGTVERVFAPWSDFSAVRRAHDTWTKERRAPSEIRRTSHVASVIEIVHPESDKSVPVYYGNVRSKEGFGSGLQAADAPRDLWEAWARALELPAVEADRARTHETLDLSLKEKVARGIDADAWTDAEPPPPGLLVARTTQGGDEAFEILMPRAGGSDVMFMVTIGFGAVLMLAGAALWAYLHTGAGMGLIGAGALFAAFGVLPMLIDFRPRCLHVTRRDIAIERGRPFSSAKPGRLALEDVEEVLMRGGGDHRRIAIVADAGEIHTGTLRPEPATWLRDFLVAAIARA